METGHPQQFQKILESWIPKIYEHSNCYIKIINVYNYKEGKVKNIKSEKPNNGIMSQSL